MGKIYTTRWTMGRGIFYTMIGYVSGSVLYAKVFGKLFCQKDVTEDTIDGNPGTTNAFLNGGIWCGICTLLCDLLKGILPVYAYMHGLPGADIWITFVLAAPVAGHIFPVFHRFRGGKGIAVSFGGAARTLSIYETSAAAGKLFSLILLCDCDHAELS
ncbi:MAG: glycerol-3-phosphate acyltransferase [Faecalimonas sp.]